MFSFLMKKKLFLLSKTEMILIKGQLIRLFVILEPIGNPVISVLSVAYLQLDFLLAQK